MYMLHSKSVEESVELELKLRTELALLAKASLRKLQAEKLAQSDPFSEPADLETSSKLGSITRSMLLEYRGEGGFYRTAHYGEELSSNTQMQIGRAMVLANREFGLLDEIVLGIFSEIFGKHLRADPLSFSSPSTATPNFGYSYLERVFRDYLRPGLSYGHPYELKFKSYLGTVHLQLEERSGRLSWALRGASKLRGSHRELAAELNRALADYSQRLEWMERYRRAVPKPGLGSNALAAVRAELKLFHSKSLDLSSLEPGVSFGDEPVILEEDDSEVRAYFSRCGDCGLPALVEIRSSYSSRPSESGAKRDWSSSRGTFRVHFSENSLNRILARNHKQTGCSHRSARSSRTGELLPMDEY